MAVESRKHERESPQGIDFLGSVPAVAQNQFMNDSILIILAPK